MAPPVVNGFISKQPSQGESAARLKWFYVDDSTLGVISPTAIANNAYLRDPSDLYRSATNTSMSSAIPTFSFTPTLDIDGGYYVDVNFDNSAPTGQWYIQTSFTHEGVTRTMYLVFSVVSAGASVSGESSLYCTSQDVRRFMFRNVQEFDANTVLSKLDVEEIIRVQMQVIDDYCQRSWRLNVQTDELCDVTYADKWRWSGDYIATFQTTYRPIRTVTSIQVNNGGIYTDIVGLGEDRTSTWYMHQRAGVIYIIGAQIPTPARNGVKVSYQWGDATVPDSIRGACYRLVAAEILESEHYAVSLPEESNTAGTVKDKVERWTKRAYDMMKNQADLIYATSGG